MEWRDRLQEMKLEDYATGWWDAAEGRGNKSTNRDYVAGYDAGQRCIGRNLEISVRPAITPLN